MRHFLTLPIATLVLALSPIRAFADSGALDELSSQVEATANIHGTGTYYVEGAQPLTIEDFNRAREAQQAAQQSTQTEQPYNSSTNTGTPNPINTVSDRLDNTLDPNRFIDPLTGRIDGAIDGVTSRVNNAIDRTLDRILSPVDSAVDNVFDQVDGAIDRTLANIMAPVDNVINDIMAGIDRQLEGLLGGIFGEDGAVGSVLNDVTGGLFGSIFGSGDHHIEVKPVYDPISPLPAIITATSFEEEVKGITAPYIEGIPFQMGSMGVPDYSTIRPMLDALAKGENGYSNRALQLADRFSSTPETLKASLSGEVERLASRSIAQATLSEVGQDDMKARLQGAEATLETIVEIGDASQDLDVTQDVMKSLTAQLANDSVIRAGQYEQDILARQQAAADAVVNAEIAQLLSEQNRATRADRAGSAAKMHTMAGQLHLPGEMADD